ncbi:hypothetical protein SOCE26_020720 [Sorangium cellulosum]|uniref:DNA alkylation repair protein n=1 Tax=Sorangium cellulosum TaxID=56 RepID=A0A2L0EMY7_SORCE|nr:DNA alkylation repair protein [Sorangium cellulosum]AUX40671.1 hypothetical protein SOCE26_020720 [Sorangium cellulosum]
MATSLKLFFDRDLVAGIAAELRAAHRGFDARGFTAAAQDGLDALELTARARHIAAAMHHFLPARFPQAAAILRASLPPPREHRDGEPAGDAMAPFRYLPHVFYVAEHGLDDFEPAMQLQYELTRRFTAEFSVRAFLLRHPEATYERLSAWARDPDPDVRRLVSEGTRPRLPWAQRLPAFQRDPAPVVRLLELLKDAPERYVTRSVANNLNDIAKDNPEVTVDVCQRWSKDATPERRWVIRHALRSLVKGGHRGALEVSGFAAAPAVHVGAVDLPRQAALGERLRFTFDLTSTAAAPQRLLVDFVVHFIKARGGAAPRVFKLRAVDLPSAGRVRLAASVSLEDLTTRRHYPGRHRIEALVNGVPFPLGAVDVRG